MAGPEGMRSPVDRGDQEEVVAPAVSIARVRSVAAARADPVGPEGTGGPAAAGPEEIHSRSIV